MFKERNAVDFSLVPIAEIASFHWEKPGFSRPASFAQLCAIEGDGILARLWSFEEAPRCECTERDAPVYTDSCLELFLAPVCGDNRYVNFEMNKNGVYLSQIGEERENRVFIRNITDSEPQITVFEKTDGVKKAWGCEIFLSDRFIEDVYQKSVLTAEKAIRGNFYKCADLSSSPHYGAHFPVTTEKLGFHNPSCFGNIIIRKARN